MGGIFVLPIRSTQGRCSRQGGNWGFAISSADRERKGIWRAPRLFWALAAQQRCLVHHPHQMVRAHSSQDFPHRPIHRVKLATKEACLGGPEKKANACCTICPALGGRDKALITGNWFSPLQCRGIVPGTGWHYRKPLISYFQNWKLGQSFHPSSLCSLLLQTDSFLHGAWQDLLSILSPVTPKRCTKPRTWHQTPITAQVPAARDRPACG